ncbi:MAG TPA: lasso peptide biosynthesis protein [Egibacteraceae bacterium]|nr:lasso peptide biosynthesis protein [Egibacteraceae bacterium]
MRARFRPSCIAAAAWAVAASAQARRIARRGDLLDARLLPPPPLPDSAGSGVAGVLARTKASCLVRSLVLQAWHASHDRERDVVVGVRHTTGAVEAHAWLEGERNDGEYVELVRRPAALRRQIAEPLP